MRVDIPDAAAMEAFGRELADRLRAGDLVLLTGPLGAGKTTLTRGIGDGLGVRGPVQSPTFVLARTHPNLAGGPPLTLKEIGEKMGISRERVRQIECQAKSRLRKLFAKKRLVKAPPKKPFPVRTLAKTRSVVEH